MVYGPIAAFLVESFPAKIRYTSLSLPYHFGNGWFGGFTPLIATSIVAATGNMFAGLWFPIACRVDDVRRRQPAAARNEGSNGIWHEVGPRNDVDELLVSRRCARRRRRWPRSAPAAPLKVYISADMEGITGVASVDQLAPGSLRVLAGARVDDRRGARRDSGRARRRRDGVRRERLTWQRRVAADRPIPDRHPGNASSDRFLGHSA